MKKVSSAVVLASLSMIGQQAQAKESIDIDSNKVSPEKCEEIKERLGVKDAECVIKDISHDFAKTVKVDGKSNVISAQAIAAYATDSTGVNYNNVANPTVSYVNCHNACHGSRGWR